MKPHPQIDQCCDCLLTLLALQHDRRKSNPQVVKFVHKEGKQDQWYCYGDSHANYSK